MSRTVNSTTTFDNIRFRNIYKDMHYTYIHELKQIVLRNNKLAWQIRPR